MAIDVLLFFGSGVSLPHGLSGVKTITEKVLHGSFHRNSDTSYDSGDNSWDSHDPTEHVQEFLKLLYEQASRFLNEQGYTSAANYEQLYHLCRQIWRTKMQYEDNSAVREFVCWIESESEPIVDSIAPYLNYNLARLASEAENLIESVVWILIQSSGRVKGLDLLTDLISSDLVGECDIVTLNHDDLVERKLTEHSVTYTDGFGAPDGEVRWYEPSKLTTRKENVLLLKPHGSMTWHYFRREQSGGYVDNYALPLTNDVEHCKIASGQTLYHLGSGRPEFLSGGSKELIYNSGIYANYFDAVVSAFQNRKRIVMSGFGWNDVGMSLRLTSWLENGEDRRIILLHEDPDQIQFESRGIRADTFKSLVDNGKLSLVKKWFSNCTLDDLKPLLS